MLSSVLLEGLHHQRSWVLKPFPILTVLVIGRNVMEARGLLATGLPLLKDTQGDGCQCH